MASNTNPDESLEEPAFPKAPQLVINLTFSRYPVVEDIARRMFDLTVTRAASDPWDILWTDTVYLSLT